MQAMHYLSLILLILVTALQAADGYLTWRILRAGGRELNPIVRTFIERFGLVPGLVLSKLAMVALVGVYVRDQLPALIVIAVLYAWVVRHNWRQLPKGGNA